MNKSRTVFVDTSGFKALVDPKDEFHLRAVKVWADFAKSGTKLVSSNYILDESYTVIRIKCGLEVARKFRELLASNGEEIKIMRITLSDEHLAWGWFERNWSKLSFTDCTCFALMKRLGLGHFFGFDEHFERAGFESVAGVETSTLDLVKEGRSLG